MTAFLLHEDLTVKGTIKTLQSNLANSQDALNGWFGGLFVS